jgi:hypothetical protein
VIFENELITAFVAKYIFKAESNDHAKENSVIDEDCTDFRTYKQEMTLA